MHSMPLNSCGPDRYAVSLGLQAKRLLGTHTHLDMNAAAMEPIFTVVALNHECVIILAAANAVRLECFCEPIHQLTVGKVDIDIVCLLL